MGIAKYKELGIPYHLGGASLCNEDIAAKAAQEPWWRHQGPIDAIGGVHQNTTSIIIKFEDNYLLDIYKIYIPRLDLY